MNKTITDEQVIKVKDLLSAFSLLLDSLVAAGVLIENDETTGFQTRINDIKEELDEAV